MVLSSEKSQAATQTKALYRTRLACYLVNTAASETTYESYSNTTANHDITATERAALMLTESPTCGLSLIKTIKVPMSG